MVKNNILVTGGFGLLGKPLVLKLINSNNNVFPFIPNAINNIGLELMNAFNANGIVFES